MRAIRARFVFVVFRLIFCIIQINSLLFRYNPYLQAKGRIDQLRSLGHSTDKVECTISY
jgi:hypothetical protein